MTVYCHALFLSGRLPCCICNQHRAHDVLLLSCWSSYSFNLPALAQFTVQINRICSTHGKITRNALAGGETDFALQISGSPFQVPSLTFSGADCQWVMGLVPSLLWRWQCAWMQCGRHPLISFSKAARSRATQHMQMESKKPYTENSEQRSFHLRLSSYTQLSRGQQQPHLVNGAAREGGRERLKTILAPTEIAPGPRQNNVDTLNWWDAYVLFFKALHHFWQEWTIHPL